MNYSIITDSVSSGDACHMSFDKWDELDKRNVINSYDITFMTFEYTFHSYARNDNGRCDVVFFAFFHTNCDQISYTVNSQQCHCCIHTKKELDDNVALSSCTPINTQVSVDERKQYLKKSNEKRKTCKYNSPQDVWDVHEHIVSIEFISK